MSTCVRIQIDPYLSSCTKLKYKWIKDLNINPVTLNLVEGRVGSSLKYMDREDHFLKITPVAQTLRTTINRWNLLKLRRTQSLRQNGSLQNGKRLLLTPYQTKN